MKKIFLMFTLLATIFSAVSCSQRTTEVFEVDFIGNSESELSLGGDRIIFYSSWINEYRPEIGFSVMGDNMRSRYEEVEALYDCVIDFYNPSQGAAHLVFLNVAAMTNEIPDLIDAHASDIFSLYLADMLFPYDEIETIDLDDIKWGDKTFIRYGNFRGKQYGTFPYEWQFIPAIGGVLAFDSAKWNSLSLDYLPFDLLENGEWTWEKFEVLLRLSTYTEGDQSYIGLGFEENVRFAETLVFCNGGEIVDYKDGVYSFGLSNPNIYKALEWGAALIGEGLAKNVDHHVFNQGTLLFFHCESWKLTHAAEGMETSDTPVYGHESYGIMPFPSGPDTEYGTSSSIVHSSRRLNWIVEMGPTDKNDLGTIMNAIFAPLESTENQAWKDALIRTAFFYRYDDLENFVNMVENVRYDYSSELLSTTSQISNAIINVLVGNSSAVSAIEAIKDSVNLEIDEVLNHK